MGNLSEMTSGVIFEFCILCHIKGRQLRSNLLEVLNNIIFMLSV